MYSTCLFCHADLGRNEAVEHFPVGRRLAYDASKGRLWVVCRRCERWNLTPQEERWEAIDEAERAYRGTRLRAATDNVGLARLRDGTELVRIGAPLRPEFAAWRYGDQFGRRRRRQMLIAGSAAAALTGVVVAGPVLGMFSAGGLWQLFNFANAVNNGRRTRKRILVGEVGSRVNVRVSLFDAERARLVAESRAGFALVVGGEGGRRRNRWSGGSTEELRFSGEDALRVAGRLLPYVNRGGGSRESVRTAVDLLDTAGGATSVFATLARDARQYRGGAEWMHDVNPDRYAPGVLWGLSAPARLALEMAAHEEQERRALEGELAELERAWREAEEIAAIADDLLLPTSIGEKLDQLRGRSTARAGAASSPSSDKGSATSS